MSKGVAVTTLIRDKDIMGSNPSVIKMTCWLVWTKDYFFLFNLNRIKLLRITVANLSEHKLPTTLEFY